MPVHSIRDLQGYKVNSESDEFHSRALSSLVPPRQVFDCRAIGTVSDCISNAQTVQVTAGRSADCPQLMKAVYALIERVKPLFDQVSLGVVELTAQSNSNGDSPILVAINEKHSVDETWSVSSANQKSKISGDVREILFLGYSRRK